MKGVGILVAAVRLAQGSDLALSVAFELQLHGLGALLELLTAGDGLGDQAKKVGAYYFPPALSFLHLDYPPCTAVFALPTLP
jgi:hypothetical protein